jgi:hypothetical protein
MNRREQIIFQIVGLLVAVVGCIPAWLAVPEREQIFSSLMRDGLPNAQDLAPIATNIADFLRNIGLNPVALTVTLWISFLAREYINSYYDLIEWVMRAFGVLIVVLIITAAGVWVFNGAVWDWMTSLRFYLLVGIFAWVYGLIAYVRENGFDFSFDSFDFSYSFNRSGCLASVLAIVGFVASVLGIISFIVEYCYVANMCSMW